MMTDDIQISPDDSELVDDFREMRNKVVRYDDDKYADDDEFAEYLIKSAYEVLLCRMDDDNDETQPFYQ